MTESPSLISLNIERAKHFDLVLPFLKARDPDVICLQEVRQPDIDYLKAELQRECRFAPMGLHPAIENPHEDPFIMGPALFTRLPIVSDRVSYYAGTVDNIHTDKPHTAPSNRALLVCDIQKNGEQFRIASTHFTWTPDGLPSEEQRNDMKVLLGLLAIESEFVLVGDFNAPRGGEIFSQLSSRYTDNIPSHYRTSLDTNFHRAGKTRPQELVDKMVDVLFTTPRYSARNVELVFGVSDHAAVTSIISGTGAVNSLNLT